MPLHLLPKKSWHVGNAENIARVKRDEARAAALEEEEDRILDEYDAAKRLAILRGTTPPPPPARLTDEDRKRRIRDDDVSGEKQRAGYDKHKRRRKGEDDTDRDIRVARAVSDGSTAVRPEQKVGWGGSHSARHGKDGDTPVTDHKGHINLFPVPDIPVHDTEASIKEKREKERRQARGESQEGMKLADAAGYNPESRTPWYTSHSAKAAKPSDSGNADSDAFALVESKDVWGKPDPARIDRERRRVTSSDPFALMQSAQTKLKQVERQRRDWVREREVETKALRREEERARSRRRRREERRRDRSAGRDGDHEDVESLEGFSLDAKEGEKSRWRRDEKRRRDDGSHGRDRHPRWSRDRSRSRDADRQRRHHDRDRDRDDKRDGDRRDRDRDRNQDRDRDSGRERHGRGDERRRRD